MGTATKTIVDGTGATGPALKQLQTDFQAVAKHGANEAATAIADLNTHLGLSGPELQIVADQALKLGVNTSSLGGVLEQTGGDVDDYRQFIDDLAVAAQGTGVSAEQLLDTVSKNSARWQAGGGDVNDLMGARRHARAGVRPEGAPRSDVRDDGRGGHGRHPDRHVSAEPARRHDRRGGANLRGVLYVARCSRGGEERDGRLPGARRRHASRCRRPCRRRRDDGSAPRDDGEQDGARVGRPEGAQPRHEPEPHRARHRRRGCPGGGLRHMAGPRSTPS